MASEATESFIDVAGAKIHLLQAGSGDSLLVLHHDIGNPGWLPFYDQLARRFSVIVASHPGFGKSDRPEWMRSVRDMAIVYQFALEELRLSAIPVVGLGFGGWLALEIALMCPHRLSHLVLVNSMGIQPARGEIMDQFLSNTIEYIRAGFTDQAKFDQLYGAKPSEDQLVAWEINREMATRVAYKPYMFDQAMPHLIGGIRAKSLIIWGAEDRIVPISCGERLRDGLRARLELIPQCGQYPEVEKPAELAKLVVDFVTRDD